MIIYTFDSSPEDPLNGEFSDGRDIQPELGEPMAAECTISLMAIPHGFQRIRYSTAFDTYVYIHLDHTSCRACQRWLSPGA